MKLSTIVSFLGPDHRLVGPDVEITGIADLSDAGPADLSYRVGATLMDAAVISGSRAGAVIVSDTIPCGDGLRRPPLVLSASPRLSMIRVIKEFFFLDLDQTSSDPPISIPGAPITRGRAVTIGFYATISSIRSIGRNVTIHNHACIGEPGFNYARDELGRPVHFPHLGMVVIGDDVEVFPFANIDRGTLADTTIGNGVKIDHHVHIGHNTAIGDDTVLLAHAAIGGNAVIGRRCLIGMGVMVKDRVTIGDDVTVDMGSCVTRDIPANTIVRK
jgi:UDP-3-O-[3-hydroxymyristoyl] glucosamine N-acyltransferase